MKINVLTMRNIAKKLILAFFLLLVSLFVSQARLYAEASDADIEGWSFLRDAGDASELENWTWDYKLFFSGSKLGIKGVRADGGQACLVVMESTNSENRLLEMQPVPCEGTEDEVGDPSLGVGSGYYSTIYSTEDGLSVDFYINRIAQTEIQVDSVSIATEFLNLGDPTGGDPDDPVELTPQQQAIYDILTATPGGVGYCLLGHSVYPVVGGDIIQGTQLAGVTRGPIFRMVAKFISGGSNGGTYTDPGSPSSELGTTQLTITGGNAEDVSECLRVAYGDALAEYIDNPLGDDPDDLFVDPGSEEEVAGADDCQFEDGILSGIADRVSNPLDWFGCAVIEGLVKFTDTAESAISTALKVDFDSDTRDQLQPVWSTFVTIANILFVIAFLIMIVSTALNLGFFDNYTVKKLLPRMVIAIIIANLSFAVCATIINIVNDIAGVIPAIFASITEDVNPGSVAGGRAVGAVAGGSIAAALFVAAGAIATAGVFAVVPMLLAVIVAVITGLAVVILRRVLIILLVVSAPIAIVLWVLPGGENLAKKWWKLFLQMLMIYPIMIALIASGQLVASIFTPANTDEIGVFDSIAVLGALILPFFLFPTVFKMANATLGNVAARMNGASKGLRDASRKKRSEKLSEGFGAMRQGRKFGGTNKFSKAANWATLRATRPSIGLAGVTNGRIGGKARAQYRRTLSSDAYAAQEELYKAGVRDHDVANELATHGASAGTIRKRVAELRGQGREDLAQRLERVQDLNGGRYQIGAMEIAAGFGKLDDRALRALDDIYSSPGELGAKAAALGSLREASKKNGNFATFAAGLDKSTGKIETLSNADGSINQSAELRFSRALQDAGPGILGQMKQYENIDDSGKTIYDVKAAGVSAVTRSSVNMFDSLERKDGGVLGGVHGDAQRVQMSPDEVASRQRRAVEQLVQVRQAGAYTDFNTKTAADRAYQEHIAGNGEMEALYREIENDMIYRGRQQQFDGDGNLAAPAQPPGGPTRGPQGVPRGDAEAGLYGNRTDLDH